MSGTRGSKRDDGHNPSNGTTHLKSSSKASEQTQQSNSELSKERSLFSPLPPGLKFVNFSSSGNGDNEGIRRLVRSNATRHFHATKRHALVADFREAAHTKQVMGQRTAKPQKTATVYSVKSAESSRECGRDDHLPLLVEGSEKTSTLRDIFDRHAGKRQPLVVSFQPAISRLGGSQVTSLHRDLGSGRTDPFLTYPLPMSDFGKGIIDYYITVICPAHDRLGPPRFKTDNIFSVWLPKAMTSTIMFASLLMTASRALTDLSSERRYNLYALHYKDIVLQLLREEILNSRNHVSDETLAALLSIKWDEFGTGNMVAYKVHNRAIARFVSLRGGLECLGMKGLLAHVIKSHDLGDEKNFSMGFNRHQSSTNIVKDHPLDLIEDFVEGVKNGSQPKVELPSYYKLMFTQYRKD